MPHHQATPPTPDEIAGCLKRYKVLGLRYTLPAGQRGKPGAIYFARGADYDLPLLAREMRGRVERGLRQCNVRPISFDELREQGMPLNLETLARMRHADPYFSDPALWERFCQAAAQSPAAQAWGAFVDGQLAAYSFVFQLGSVAVLMYQMARTSLLPMDAGPALNFTQTRHLLRAPGVSAVSFGHEGLDATSGQGEYKQALGFEPAPVTFVVNLRPAMRLALLNPLSTVTLSLLRRALPANDLLQRVQAVLAIAAVS